MRIVKYDVKYDEYIKDIEEVTFYTVKYHPDVIKESIAIVLDNEIPVAIGYLKAGATFLKVDKEELDYYFIHAEFLTSSVCDVEIQVTASAMILEELKAGFLRIQDRYSDKRLILRIYARADAVNYIQFLMEAGFRQMRIMPIMVKNLLETDTPCLGDKIELDDGQILFIKEMDPNDDGFMSEYTKTNREAFEVEDSANELRFIMGGEDSHVYAVMDDNRVAACLTTWRINSNRAATENIFCAEKYRNRKITTQLLEYVFDKLKAWGYEEASLTVFGDNQPAQQLYLKLGYEVEGLMIELHYEKEYKNIGY